MWTDWIHWLSQKHPNQLLGILWALLLVDSPRYAFSCVAMAALDMLRGAWLWLRGVQEQETFSYCPSVCVIIAGYNEAQTIGHTLASLWGTYPRLEVIVVNDGSEDETAQVAYDFAQTHAGVQVLSRSRRSGKPSALNFALAYVRAEIVVFVDADCHLGPHALWHLVQPFQDPRVGGVSATILVRNMFTNLVTWLQCYEYLNTIFLGRHLMARLGLLSIISGGYGAYSREVLDRCGGADVEPAEDLDLTLRSRRAGYRIAFAPQAQCFTNVPSTWRALARQRLRWEQSSVLRLICRKHLDMAYPWSPNFRWSNFFVCLDMWIFNIFLVLGIWAYALWLALYMPSAAWGMMGLTLYLGYMGFELLRVLSVLFYSRDLRRDLAVCAILPLVPLYQLFLFLVRSRALVEETFWRTSYEHNYIPLHVRQATWRW
jgi:cellulose synthase/poly-beta-1,6-N-acetylglucosamine synthase-like glycosyltransferase